MIREEQEIFIQFSGESRQRILHPARVTLVRDAQVQFMASELDLPFEPDQGIRVFHQSRDFMQQTANVVGIDEDDRNHTVTIEWTSEAVSAESRTCYRVSTVITELTASLGSEKSCRLVDVSMMGFAVIATDQYAIGDLLEAELRFNGHTYSGRTCVQSVRDLGAGRIRYGLLPLATDDCGTQMLAGMQVMTAELQRRQLKRLSGVV